MQITLDMMEEITQDAFEQFTYGNDKVLKAVVSELTQLAKHNSPLSEMLRWEFNTCWNNLFAKTVLEHQEQISFPQEVDKYPGQWLVLWKEYFHHKFYQTQTPLNERALEDIKMEVDVLKTLFLAMSKDFNLHTNQSLTNLLSSIPYSSSEEQKFDEQSCFECAVFAWAKLESEQFFYDNAAEDLETILRAYYGQHKQDRDNIIFKTYIPAKHNIDEIIEKKCDYFRPKTDEQRLFIGSLLVNKDAYVQALNELGGLKGQHQAAMTLAFERIFIEHHFLELQKKLDQKTQTFKKSKI